ncbi:BQ2448_7590 [Microbotryum intermedium]|uniref:BQ2448_7587 protein n=1 Tax=Microbotryum intermedium TaxID=269621 RepID=A0A238FTK7_9BASI|nr:BQ2448_7587 [Microbotryum intermedium]SCV74561.1 BQ2448_7590 [Microbotryum intermedium]
MQYYLDCKNLTPHAGLNGDIPNAIWHGKPQDLSRLRTFSCRAWATVPQHKCTKLEPKGTPLIFSIRISRNVTFIETEFPAAKRHICAPTKPTIVHTTVFQPIPIEAPAHPAVPATTSSSSSSATSSIAPLRAPLPTTSASSDTASDSEIDTPCPSPRERLAAAPPAPPSPLSDDSTNELDLIAGTDAFEPDTMHDAATTNVLLELPPFADNNDLDDPIALLSQVARLRCQQHLA